MNKQEKIEEVVKIADDIKIYKKMIYDINNALAVEKLELSITNGSTDASVVIYRDNFYSKTNLIKVGLKAMKTELEEQMSKLELKLEDIFSSEQ